MQPTAIEFRQPPIPWQNTAADVPLVLVVHDTARSGRMWRALADQLRGVAEVCAPICRVMAVPPETRATAFPLRGDRPTLRPAGFLNKTEEMIHVG